VIAMTQDLVVDTVDGTRLTDRQQEFARDVGATSALSGTVEGCVFLYKCAPEGTLRWWISPAGHPLAVTCL
jgi:hypothetical protein